MIMKSIRIENVEIKQAGGNKEQFEETCIMILMAFLEQKDYKEVFAEIKLGMTE